MVLHLKNIMTDEELEEAETQYRDWIENRLTPDQVTFMLPEGLE
jgi:hypothetical protein